MTRKLPPGFRWVQPGELLIKEDSVRTRCLIPIAACFVGTKAGVYHLYVRPLHLKQ